MRPFTYVRAETLPGALDSARTDNTMFLAGGTELLNWARIGIETPSRLVDIGRLPELHEITPTEDGGLRIGALARLNDVAQDARVETAYPVFSQAILKAASAQLRNLATIGGNPVQRVRCPYFRSNGPVACNKRVPGSGCAALHGANSERFAIFGWTEDCVAVQPSDPAVALACLDAEIITEHGDGGRRIPATEFHTLPDVDPAAHNVLRPGELITGIELGAPAPRSAYVKVRERQSYEYALVSAAAAVEVTDGVISRARVALGSVALRPWRLYDAEAALVGLTPGSPEVRDAVTSGFSAARPLSSNAYKIPLARNTALRALELALEA
ncbi:xanthine dehydrogenase family protein subunit M [Streptomyces sp. J2-1]|uniref:FAD binding domain-containing protein n=1 Tax=Streptomyces corallincola TaxID=2851888 RepID=UPI001C381B31|nr:xanthine dehydrogenase family protein subunit M [Streptomyces corallincola]MBV2353843.1 xanthine dehydrogenase family protein subunit M [Streptomyces corallincola]